MLWIEGGSGRLKGSSGARIFRKGTQPIEIEPGARLDDLVNVKATVE